MDNNDQQWIPNVGDHYKTIMWSAGLGFHTHDCVWENDNADNEKLKNGNVFRYVSDAQVWCNCLNTYLNNPMMALRERDRSVDFKDWVSVTDRLPEKLKSSNTTLTVLFTDGDEIFSGVYDHKWKFWICAGKTDLEKFTKTITHWRPYPELPKKYS